jgi:phosphoglycerate dehydrogenase-like enzyme
MKIVLAGLRVTPERVAELERVYPDVEFVVPAGREELIGLIEDADAVYGNLTDAEFEAARKLRWIQAVSAGVEFMWQIPSITRTEVVVTNMRGAHAATIAEHAFAMLLSLTRALREFDAFQERHEWARGLQSGHLVGIKGMTMGIVGFGNIGRAIARRALGFEMRVLAVDPHAVPGQDAVDEFRPGATPGLEHRVEGVEAVSGLERLDDLCREVDVLAVSAPITPRTRGLVGPSQIELLKPGSYLLVVSRGKIVDEPALIRALESGKLAGAGLDVTATEPLPPDDPLWRAPNLIITPHTSAGSDLTWDLTWSILTENVGRFIRGEELVNVVDKELGY